MRPPVIEVDEQSGGMGPPRGTMAALATFAGISLVLLTTGQANYPNLHTVLDTAVALLSGLLAVVLWDTGKRTSESLPRMLAVGFALTSTLEICHVLVTVDWYGPLAPIAAAENFLRPATWPPSAHLLPIGIAFAMGWRERGDNRIWPLTLLLIGIEAALLAVFQLLPAYTTPVTLGITRPTLIVVPFFWASIGATAWHLRASNRIMPSLAVMAIALFFGNIAILYSHAPHDAVAMIAHLGKVVGYLIVLLGLMQIAASDTRARIRAEATLVRVNEELEAANKTLARVNRELVAANKEMETFSYSVSHDLRSPLNVILGFADTLTGAYGAHLPRDVRQILGRIVRSADRMAKLIDDLMRLSHLGRQALSKAPVDVAELVDDVWEELVRGQDGTRLDLRVHDLPPCFGDRALLRQVFANLLSNALKFTRGKDRALIEVSGRLGEGERIYSVRDNGAGFDMGNVGKLFGAFQRLHRADQFEGSGVGLSIARRIIERHNGRIWADAEVDKGAAFYFSIPDGSDELPGVVRPDADSLPLREPAGVAPGVGMPTQPTQPSPWT